MTKYQVISLFEDEMGEDVVSLLQGSPSFSTKSCGNEGDLMTAMEWEPPDLITIDESCERFQSGQDQVERWLQILFQKQWFLPILLFSNDPAKWRKHRSPFLFAVSPSATTEMVGAIVQEHMKNWKVWRPERPLSLSTLLVKLCSQMTDLVALAELENSETAILEISGGNLWRVGIGVLQGESAMRRMAKYNITQTKELEVKQLPHPTNIHSPWQSFLKQNTPVPGAGSAKGLETRTSVERMSIQELISGYEEKLEGAASKVTPKPLPVPMLNVPPASVAPMRAKAPARELYKLLELIATDQLPEASSHAMSLQQQWPGEPSLRALWMRALLQL